jgi:chromosomal replication initiation ATPase DnaA
MDRINEIYAELGSHYSAIKSLTKELKTMDVFTTPQLHSYDICKVVCEYFEIELEEVMSRSRKRESAITRHIVRYFYSEYTAMNLNQIAKVTFATDHTTVIHSIKTVNKLVLKEDRHFRRNIEDIRHTLNQLAENKSATYKALSFKDLQDAIDAERGEDFECPYNEDTCNS